MRGRVRPRHTAIRVVDLAPTHAPPPLPSDVGTLLRVLGWMRTHRDRSADEGEPPPLTMKAVVGSPRFAQYVAEYVDWLQEREPPVKFSSIANYANR